MTRIISEFEFLTAPFEWTLERYHAMIEAGILTEYDKVELIKGQLVRRMPIGDDHAFTVENLMEFFVGRFAFQYRLRSENPISVLPNSEPEPDFVVAEKPVKKSRPKHPTPAETLLIVEVAYSTLQYDRKVKGPIYAEAGIAEYWIINLKARKVEVHLNPDTDEALYGSVLSYKEGEIFISPFVGEVRVNNLLPVLED